MKVKSLGTNKTLVSIGNNEILVSYETPVAGFISGMGYFRTSTFHSKTTSKHINQYLNGITKVSIIPQGRINKMLE
jgi:hypothetical protein